MCWTRVFFSIDNVLFKVSKHTKKGLCLMIGLPTYEQGYITRYCQGCFWKGKWTGPIKLKAIFFRFVHLIFGGFDETMSTRLAEICHCASLASLLHQSSQSKGLEMFFFSHCSLQDINKQECQQTPQELQKIRVFIVAMNLEGKNSGPLYFFRIFILNNNHFGWRDSL